MIRFPERSHASTTPDAAHLGVEPNYQESERAQVLKQRSHTHAARAPLYDFAGIETALGARHAK